MDDNVKAFGELGFRPRIADLPRDRDQSTRILGEDISLPVIISPTGVQAVSPGGEVAVARAAATAGTAIGLSSFASKAIEDVAEANPKVFFQMYWVGTRDRILQRAERAKKAGAKALIVTLDWSFATRRDWGSPPIPERLDLKAMLRFAPEGILRPRWLLDFMRHGGLPDLTTPNLAAPGEQAPTFFGAYGEWMGTPLPTWEDVRWLREEWGGPFMVKGIMHPDDARRAVESGADGIVISNHGGRQVDGAIATLDALPAIVESVGGRVPLILDSGIRGGADAFKALALGATAVLLGRPYVYGLAIAGEAGVREVIQNFTADFDLTMACAGCRAVADIGPDCLSRSD
jgi:L-lactate dehydrogenase (cytochrome)